MIFKVNDKKKIDDEIKRNKYCKILKYLKEKRLIDFFILFHKKNLRKKNCFHFMSRLGYCDYFVSFFRFFFLSFLNILLFFLFFLSILISFLSFVFLSIFFFNL